MSLSEAAVQEDKPGGDAALESPPATKGVEAGSDKQYPEALFTKNLEQRQYHERGAGQEIQ